MSELPKRNVAGRINSQPAGPARSNDAAKLDSARAALARAIAAHQAENPGSSEDAENAETEADRNAPGQRLAAPGSPHSSGQPADEAPPATSPRRRVFPRNRRWALVAAAGAAVVAVVVGVAVTVGGGSDSSGHRADAPAEGLIGSDDGGRGAGERSPLPGVTDAEPTASSSASPTSSSSSESARDTPRPDESATSAKPGSSRAADTPGPDSAVQPDNGDPGGPAAGSGGPLVVEASGKCLTGTGAGSQLVASACDGSAGQSWSSGPDGSLRQGGLCATLTGTEDRTPVVLTTCDQSATQRIGLSGTALVAGSNGKCLDLFGGASGTQIVLWECNGRDNQRWRTA
ncbi:RICIN domain-containing protein [Streptomyces nitrosporeus]|uniref:RICIN domain-containing protein n=1 Tax=Streptomyces nitrosporeus TaxID=28894 RepID=UPI00123DD1F1|nr:RICIN domain-containing protein [Streptomyces nitrosporeus]GGY77103.1 hypothetical protein GCM10010327_03950 [Streptomyces nitrosporeus]